MDNQPQYNPVQPSNQRPSFEQPQQQPSAIQAHTPKRKGGPKTALIILLALLAVAGVGAGVYFWQKADIHQAEVAVLKEEVKSLNARIDALADAKNDEDSKEVGAAADDRLEIQELGIELALTDDLTGATYELATDSELLGVEVITAKFGGECALGMVARHDGSPEDTSLLYTYKQFEGFYVSYATPHQSPECPRSVTNDQLMVLMSALGTAVENATEL